MSTHALTALSPLDGRYASKVETLRPIFSEFGLMHRRVQVEIEWLLALAADPKIVELPAFTPAQTAQQSPQSSPGMRDVTPRPNSQPGMTTGAAPSRPTPPQAAPKDTEIDRSANPPANSNDNR